MVLEFMKSILDEAKILVNKDRQQDYGDPRDDFERIATIWSTLLSNKLETNLTSSEVGAMMIALKLSRAVHKNKRDNWIDIAGYAHCADLCTTYTTIQYD
tara:strand:- start:3199 stop:3498 length:300 start_codon:yes stop_codon:yes gene_type:complete